MLFSASVFFFEHSIFAEVPSVKIALWRPNFYGKVRPAFFRSAVLFQRERKLCQICEAKTGRPNCIWGCDTYGALLSGESIGQSPNDTELFIGRRPFTGSFFRGSIVLLGFLYAKKGSKYI